jgi:hypothetical protein
MKKLLLVALALSVISCVPKSLNTESGRNAWRANQVAIRVNELSATVIQMNALGEVSDTDTRTFGTWAKISLKTLDAVPTGWEKTVQTGWTETKAKLPVTFLENPKVKIAVAVLESLLQFLNPPEVPNG